MSCRQDYSNKSLYKTRLLVIDPYLGNAILNSLGFIQEIQSKCNIFYSVISCDCLNTVNEALKELCDNQGFYYLYNLYLTSIDINDVLPRINPVTTLFEQQADIFKGYYPQLVIDIRDNLTNLIERAKPDYILTCLGSLYIYNVLISDILTTLFPKDKIFRYKDYPYAGMNTYNCIKQISSFIHIKKIQACSNLFTQKKYLLENYLGYRQIQCNCNEIIYRM